MVDGPLQFVICNLQSTFPALVPRNLHTPARCECNMQTCPYVPVENIGEPFCPPAHYHQWQHCSSTLRKQATTPRLHRQRMRMAGTLGCLSLPPLPFAPLDCRYPIAPLPRPCTTLGGPPWPEPPPDSKGPQAGAHGPGQDHMGAPCWSQRRHTCKTTVGTWPGPWTQRAVVQLQVGSTTSHPAMSATPKAQRCGLAYSVLEEGVPQHQQRLTQRVQGRET